MLIDLLTAPMIADFVKTTFAVFAGAGLAFLSNAYFKRKQRRHEELASANLATFTLSRYCNVYLSLQAELAQHRESLEADPQTGPLESLPSWVLVPPIASSGDRDIKLGFDKLHFLIKRGNENLLGELSICQEKFLRFRNTIDAYNEVHARVKERVAAVAVPTPSISAESVEILAGAIDRQKLNSLSSSILSDIPENLAYTESIAATLHRALVSKFGEGEVLLRIVSTNDSSTHR